MKIRRTVRNAKELRTITGTEDKIWVVWGAGERGWRFLRDVRRYNLEQVFIYDMDDNKMPCEKERIYLNTIKEMVDRIFWVISVADKKMAYEIAEQIVDLGGAEEGIYRYVPEDYLYVAERLSKVGFYNGISYQKTLEDSEAKALLEKSILGEKPFLFARWGVVEGDLVYGVGDGMDMLTEWEVFVAKNNAGIYPSNMPALRKFADIYADAARYIDILCTICGFVKLEDCYEWYSPNAVLVTRELLFPFWREKSWTHVLKGKKVLVIHPFAKLIEEQYGKRRYLFEDPDILPEMDLKVYRAVQSIGGNTEYASWFDALAKMEQDISEIDFEIALIGCGAYGMPLGAFIKAELRKKAIHLGGTLQLLFGIKGKRWEHPSYGFRLYNEHWVRPTEDLRPSNYKNVEDGCYW